MGLAIQQKKGTVVPTKLPWSFRSAVIRRAREGTGFPLQASNSRSFATPATNTAPSAPQRTPRSPTKTAASVRRRAIPPQSHPPSSFPPRPISSQSYLRPPLRSPHGNRRHAIRPPPAPSTLAPLSPSAPRRSCRKTSPLGSLRNPAHSTHAANSALTAPVKNTPSDCLLWTSRHSHLRSQQELAFFSPWFL